jgi:hypothetical protein
VLPARGHDAILPGKSLEVADLDNGRLIACHVDDMPAAIVFGIDHEIAAERFQVRLDRVEQGFALWV